MGTVRKEDESTKNQASQREWASWVYGMVRRIRLRAGKKVEVNRVYCIPNTTLLAVGIAREGEGFGMHFAIPSAFVDDIEDTVAAVNIEFRTIGLIPKEKAQAGSRLVADG